MTYIIETYPCLSLIVIGTQINIKKQIKFSSILITQVTCWQNGCAEDQREAELVKVVCQQAY